MIIGALFNPGALWIGAHYSPINKRLCINLLPCFTVYFVWPGGYVPVKNNQGRAYRKKYNPRFAAQDFKGEPVWLTK